MFSATLGHFFELQEKERPKTCFSLMITMNIEKKDAIIMIQGFAKGPVAVRTEDSTGWWKDPLGAEKNSE